MFRIMASVALIAAPAIGAAQAPPAAAPSTYALGAGDKVRIIVYGEDALSGEYSVTGDGEIAFPLIGNVAAVGASTTSLQETIRARLMRGYINDPRVSVEILDYRPFYILGEVAKPGQYPFANGLTVAQAVATAGGYTYRASTRKIYIKHAADTVEAQVDLRTKQPIAVQPGDTIRVAERFF